MVMPSYGLAYPSTAHVRNALRKAGLRQAANSVYVVRLDYGQQQARYVIVVSSDGA